jgi:hypothetical protein
MIRGILAMGRRMADSMMEDTCRITSDGETAWDEETLANVTGPRVTVYEGKCRLLSPYRAPTTASTPGQVQAVQLSGCHCLWLTPWASLRAWRLST